MNKTNIEYVDMTWNPVTGCMHDCSYCYARKRAHRFAGYDLDGQKTTHNPYGGPAVLNDPMEIADKFGKRRRAAFPFGFDPTLHVYRLDEPLHYHKPRTIFVGSMTDMFGEWVPDDWIERVFDTCRKAPQHRYLFLTKNPSRYMKLIDAGRLPPEHWYGETQTHDELRGLPKPYKHFVSVEPLLGETYISPMTRIGWIIIGAMTGPGTKEHQPRREWIEHICKMADGMRIPIFMKDSLAGIVEEKNMRREFPWS
jgi:protein gp37